MGRKLCDEDQDYNQDNINETEGLPNDELTDEYDLLPTLLGEEVSEEVGEILHDMHLDIPHERDPGWPLIT